MLMNIIRRQFNVSDKLIETALDMATQDINANWTAFGKTPTDKEILTIFELCLKIAKRLDI